MKSANIMNGAEAMVRMLDAYQVRHIFGLCGDTSLPFYDALYRLDHNIEHILTRDERNAAYMADGYARVTKKVGVCEGPSGGGATYILPGLIEANLSCIPILAITSDVSTLSQGHYPLTELDQDRLMRPLTKFNAVIQSPDALPDLVRTAFRNMTTGRAGSAHLAFPIDVQRGACHQGKIWSDPAHGSCPAYPFGPDMNILDDALDAILSAKFPIIICGGGVPLSGAKKELLEFVEKLDICVATSISGQGSILESHPNCVGVVGSNGGVPETRQVVDMADLVIFIGCRAGSVTTELWRHPSHGTRIVHIDSDPEAIGATYQTEVTIVSDARLALQGLNTALAKRESEISFGGADAIAPLKAQKWSKFGQIIGRHRSDQPIPPEVTISVLQSSLGDDSIIVADPGTPCPYVSAYLPLRSTGMQIISNRAHGALGYALPAAIGAAIGAPQQKTVALMGDGSFGFTCGELETVVRLNLPLTCIIFSNSTYGWIKAGQKAGFGKRYYAVDFDRTNHRAVAEAFGVRAWQVKDPQHLAPILCEALGSNEPTLIDIISQPLQEANAPVSEWIA